MQQRVVDTAHVSLTADAGGYYDEEAQELIMDAKREREIRHGFVSKVYGILSVQLLITSALGCVFTVVDSARFFIVTNYWFYLTAAILSLILLLVLVCGPYAQRYPTNYILLFAFTVCEAIAVGGACAHASIQSGGIVVLQAFIATTVIVVALTIFAFQTKYDFTSHIAILIYVSIACSVVAIFTLFFRATWFQGLICGVFALITCAHLVIDTQVLIGSGRVKATVDDYVLCAVMLYVDIVNLFLYLLKLLQMFQRD